MNTMVNSEDLFNYVLMSPRFSCGEPETLRIVSGYASHAMAARHLIEMSKQKKSLFVDLVYGMAGSDGVSKINHFGFVSLEQKKEFFYEGAFSCSYVKKPISIHSKIYVWCKGEVPVKAFIGSANYSENAFNSSSRVETLSECDPDSALSFFHKAKLKAIACGEADRERDFLVKPHTASYLSKSATPFVTIEQNKDSPYFGHEKIVLSLLSKRGDAGNGSGLNWGVRPGGSPRVSRNASGSVSRRNRDQAYIRLPSSLQKTGFFPDIAHRFTVLTDDNKILTCVRAQQNGKAIETPQDNSEIGRYFRERLGLPSGTYITVPMLKRYGRDNVTFYKLDDENYVMDFSTPN